MCIIVITNESFEKGWVRQWWTWLSCAFAGALVVFVILFLSIWPILRDINENSPKNKPSPVQYPFEIPANLTDEDTKYIEDNLYRFVPRQEWAARPPKGYDHLQLPLKKVVITHTASDSCYTKLECISLVKSIQDFHMDSRDWNDIAYNFLVAGDGGIYVGRGWDDMGAHTRGYNLESYGIAFIGTFTEIIPPPPQVDSVKVLINIGVRLGKLTKDYELYGHRQLISTDSPGAGVYNIIITWPHWKKTDLQTSNTTMTTNTAN